MSDAFGNNKGKVSAGAWVVRGILGLIAVVTLYLIITARSGDVGTPFAGDHWNGNLWDWLGVIVFSVGVLFLAGLGDYVFRLFSKKGSAYQDKTAQNTGIAVALLLGGILLIVLTN